AQHAQPVFCKALRGIANCAHQFCRDIGASAHKINHLFGDWIVKHPVNGEVAPPCVFLWRRKMHSRGMSPIDVSVIGTKGGHFELKTVLQHDDYAKMCADGVRAWEKLLHGFRCRAGSDIVVLWRHASNNVAYTATSEVRNVKGGARIGVPNVQIEKEKIDHVSVMQAICEITQNAGKQQRKREIAPCITQAPSHEQNRHND